MKYIAVNAKVNNDTIANGNKKTVLKKEVLPLLSLLKIYAHINTAISIPKKSGFIASTMNELKMVVWPSRQQLFSESIAVILMVTLSAASIAAVSRFFGWGASQIFQ